MGRLPGGIVDDFRETIMLNHTKRFATALPGSRAPSPGSRLTGTVGSVLPPGSA
eukprot:CAMPEP_0173396518 /NCGR_PEP_ID=MMETSP1356-20130122/35722_1 /TAXON_ID=77927 ORGANISM="Hemiselmis virescens, Strain PCC157" /NCGR_SAMPLE_ID=MMETSP1356 /ASSEMBLY_ACC=CAM_ASM_000847 /LENGTH=53 /DNA_ID=CAMNT_0014355575 /DNA_START=160 /DNA_END=317 /DNA_ORIENTATION=+